MGGSSFWKMNVQIMEDEDCKQGFLSLWDVLLLCKDVCEDAAVWWDEVVKLEVVSMSKRYSARRKKIRKET